MINKEGLEINKVMTLVLRYCQSQKAIQNLQDAPFYTDQKALEVHYDTIGQMMNMLSSYGTIPLLRDFDICYNVVVLVQKNASVEIELILQFKLFLKMLADLRSYFNHLNLKAYPLVVDYYERLDLLTKLLDKFNVIMDDNGNILDTASNTLKNLRNNKKSLERSLKEVGTSVAKKYASFLSDEGFFMKDGRLTLSVKSSDKYSVKGIIHETSASKLTTFIEPQELKEMADKIESLNNLIIEEINHILKELAQLINLNSVSVLLDLDILVQLDELVAIAKYSLAGDCVRPKFSERLVITQGKHPLIAAEKVVPISLTMEAKNKVLIISGPNTGGKTAALKLVGLFSYLAMIGIWVNAKAMELPMFDNILCDIGDHQSLEESLSTFSSHLVNIIEIISQTTKNSLVLLDEIGGGTDPLEGVSLAKGIIEYLKTRVKFLLLSTHYLELKTYGVECDEALVASVAFDAVTLEPFYYLNMGVVASSNAIKIAQRLGLNPQIIAAANSYLEGNTTDISKLYNKLNEEKIATMNLMKSLDEEIKEQKKREAKFKIEQQQFELSKQKIIERDLVQARTQLDKLKLEAEELIANLQIKAVLKSHEVWEVKKQVSALEPSSQEYNFIVGTKVKILSLGEIGVVRELKEDLVFVDVDGLVLPFKMKELALSDQAVPLKKKPLRSLKNPYNIDLEVEQFNQGVSSFKGSLDLRGHRVAEVADLLDKAIEEALSAGHHSLKVIHGFGTGAIRNELQRLIKSHSFIIASRAAEYNDGGSGATYITLR
ncbi:MAG: Smr/MutS family protein [Acholeplasmatales bacterium]|jgi:DNA mismatch repair protein MutS2|nr:Smr/MutS family protein [Acholeplasmatales bacterium]